MVQSSHLQHLPHPHSDFSNSSMVTSDAAGMGYCKCSVPNRVELIWPWTQAPCPHRSSVAVKFISYRGIKGENAHFQPSAWGLLTTKHSRRFANDVTLALREKILAGMDFQVANRLWADNGQNLSVQPWLRLRTLKTLKTQNSRNGVISSKRHKNTPEVSHFYSFYWMKVKLSIF